MMNDAIRHRLMDAHVEEMRGYDSYMNLSKEACDLGYHKIGKILKDMACEEETHAKMLDSFLKED